MVTGHSTATTAASTFLLLLSSSDVLDEEYRKPLESFYIAIQLH
jgi:hypothetical protein